MDDSDVSELLPPQVSTQKFIQSRDHERSGTAKLHSTTNHHLKQHTLPSATTVVTQMSGHLLLERACMDETWVKSKHII